MSVNSTRKRSRNQKTKRENCNKHEAAAPIGIHVPFVSETNSTKCYNEWFDMKIRKQFSLWIIIFGWIASTPLDRRSFVFVWSRGDRLTCVTNGFGRSLFINMKIDKRKNQWLSSWWYYIPKICVLVIMNCKGSITKHLMFISTKPLWILVFALKIFEYLIQYFYN